MVIILLSGCVNQLPSENESAPRQDIFDYALDPFVLTISVEETTIQQGKNFGVNVELKNTSGECYEIVYSILFWPSIPGWHPFGGVAIDPPEPQTLFFESGSTIRNIGLWSNENEEWLIGYDLEPGTHELVFRANFSIITVGDNGDLTEEAISVISNTVLLTVR